MASWSKMGYLSRGFHQLFFGLFLIGCVVLKFGGFAGLYIYLGWVLSAVGVASIIIAVMNFINWCDGKQI